MSATRKKITNFASAAIQMRWIIAKTSIKKTKWAEVESFEKKLRAANRPFGEVRFVALLAAYMSFVYTHSGTVNLRDKLASLSANTHSSLAEDYTAVFIIIRTWLMLIVLLPCIRSENDWQDYESKHLTLKIVNLFLFFRSHFGNWLDSSA